VYIVLFVLYQGYQLKEKFNRYVLPSYASIISTQFIGTYLKEQILV